jgi:hypothetical protein
MSDSSKPNQDQADERIVMRVAVAMCGARTPCTYHVRLARIAIPAYRQALGAEVMNQPVTRGLGDVIYLPHEGKIR